MSDDAHRTVSEVGICDLLRFELTPNGAYNTPERGTVKDPVQFAWMLRQSPYHNVHKATAYPSVLMTTGENDPRVTPYMSRNTVTMLQANTSSPNPIAARSALRPGARNRQLVRPESRVGNGSRVLRQPAALVPVVPMRERGVGT